MAEYVLQTKYDGLAIKCNELEQEVRRLVQDNEVLEAKCEVLTRCNDELECRIQESGEEV